MSIRNKLNVIINSIVKSQEILAHRASIMDSKDLGKSYISDVTPVTINGTKRGRNVSLKVIIKMPSVERCSVSTAAASDMFNREILNYSKLLLAYENLQDKLIKSGVESDELMTFAKCYFNSMETYEVLVLEDMRHRGYKMYKDTMFMDYKRVVTVVKEVGKLHALSFVLERENPVLYNECKMHSVPIMKDKVLATELTACVREYVELDLVEVDETVHRQLSEYLEAWCKADELINISTKVIIHSDLWRNNILFKYKEGEPDRVCLLDFQIMQVHSPAYDVLYFIAISTDHKMRTQHFQQIIEVYYKALTRMISYFSIDANEVYTMEQLRQDIKRLAPFVLVRGLFSLRMWHGFGGTGESCEGGDAVEGVNTGCDKIELYRKASHHLIEDFISYAQI